MVQKVESAGGWSGLAGAVGIERIAGPICFIARCYGVILTKLMLAQNAIDGLAAFAAEMLLIEQNIMVGAVIPAVVALG